MWDFLSFQTFITPSLLIVAYYLGAIVMPFLSFIIAKYMQQRLKEYLRLDIDQRYKYLFYIAMLLCFFCMELLWRVAFEFMIAYFAMHDALMQMAHT